MKAKKPQRCPACNGTGKGYLEWGSWTKCGECGGTGKRTPTRLKTGPHDWYRPRQFAYPICRICGVVKRTDGKNKPCKGPTRLRPMEGEADV
jgi:hypothetical protein